MTRFLFVVLVLVSMCAPLGMNIVLPSLSSFRLVFDTDYATAQLTLTLYLAAVAVGQLIYGPMSDRFGRRPIILFGLVVFMIGCVIGFFATSIEMLIAGRMVQALGGCAGIVIARAMVRDLFDEAKAASVIAYLTMAFVVAPTLAPLVGGVLEDLFNWQAGFVFVFIVAVLTFVATLKGAQETLPLAKRQQTHFKHLFLSFWYLLKNPVFCSYALQMSFCTAAYFAFLGGSSYVLIELMGGTASELGVLFVFVSLFYIGGNFVTARLSQRIGVYRMVLIGTIVCMIGPLLLAITELTIGLNPISFFGLVAVVALGNGFCISSGMAGAISADSTRIGAASGLCGSMQVGFGAVSTFAAGASLSYFETTPLPLIVVIGVCTVCGFLSLTVGRAIINRTAQRVVA
ncbi:MAG: multidrug effflux MFS transporter [Sneathiella sp.]